MEEKNGTLYIFSNRRLRLRKDGTGAFQTGSGEIGIYEFKGAERDAAEGRIGAGGVGFLRGKYCKIKLVSSDLISAVFNINDMNNKVFRR